MTQAEARKPEEDLKMLKRIVLEKQILSVRFLYIDDHGRRFLYHLHCDEFQLTDSLTVYGGGEGTPLAGDISVLGRKTKLLGRYRERRRIPGLLLKCLGFAGIYIWRIRYADNQSRTCTQTLYGLFHT